MEKKDIIVASQWRTAIKDFDYTKKITDEDFNDLLKIAQYSPSSFGLEPWRIVVIQNKTTRDSIAQFASGAQRQLASASHFVAFIVRKDITAQSKYFEYINKSVKEMTDETFETFYNTFSVFQSSKFDLNDERKRTDWAGKQAYIALGNMMLAASLLRIDSCPIEGFIPFEVEKILEKECAINTNVERVAVMAAFGYRKEEPISKKRRRPISEIVSCI